MRQHPLSELRRWLLEALGGQHYSRQAAHALNSLDCFGWDYQDLVEQVAQLKRRVETLETQLDKDEIDPVLAAALGTKEVF